MKPSTKSKNDKREFLELIEDLEQRLLQKNSELLDKLVQHLQYHKKNEARWGLVKLMSDHPFRTVFAGISFGILITYILGQKIANFILKFLQGI